MFESEDVLYISILTFYGDIFARNYGLYQFEMIAIKFQIQHFHNIGFSS